MPDLVLTRTPLRLSFLGGGSDLPLYTDTGRVGCVISGTIDKYIYIMVRRRNDSKIVAHYSRREEVSSLDDLQNEYVREALRLVGWQGGIEISNQADIGVKSGLGGSSAFLVGLLYALHLLQDGTPRCNLLYSRPMLAEEAFQLETGPLGKKVGRQDHYAAAWGGFLKYSFLPDGIVCSCPLTPLRGIEARLLLLYTGQERGDLGEQIFEDIHREESEKRVLAMYAVLARLAQQGAEFLAEGRWTEMLLLMDRAWKAKRRSSRLISNDALDAVYQEVLAAGAMCGKLCGSGGGGYFLFYCPEGRETVLERLGGKYRDIPFNFTEDGTTVLLEA